MEKKIYRAYYYSFESTGVGIIDNILKEVAKAGKAFHHTSDWQVLYDYKDSENTGESCQSRIQKAADDAARVIKNEQN